VTTRLLPIAQNTGLVTFTIEVEGEPLPQRIPVYSLEVMREANRIPTARIHVADGDPAAEEWPISSADFFVPGNEVTIRAGYHNDEERIFSGVVVGQSLRVRQRRLELQVICRDRTVALTTTRKSRHFVEVTDSDATAEILAEYGLPAGTLESTPTTHTDLVQYDATDWDFIVMRMEANGLVCVPDDLGFHAVAPSVAGEPIATLQFGANVIEFDADVDARRQFGSVSTRAWDPAAQAAAEADSTEAAWVTPGNLVPGELASAVAADAQVLRHGAALGPDELQSWSDAALLRSRMGHLRGRARVQGFAAAVPGGVVELAGFGDRCNGPVWISAVRHEIGSGNWLSDIEFGMPEESHAERVAVAALPNRGLLPAISGLHAGVVTALQGDPAGEARIRVKIPSVDLEGEGIWSRVASFDAGSSRGSTFLPEIGDEVVVGFLDDDPRHPVVLGMLHSSAHAPPENASNDNHRRGIHSRSGMRILFDDEKTKVTIDTPGGRSMTLDDDGGAITCSDRAGNRIAISGSGIVIESASDLVLKASGEVSIEGQTNVTIEAGAQWKAEGGAGAEISSSAVTVVKGSLVQIN
jgi:Rhs element Vgr protein